MLPLDMSCDKLADVEALLFCCVTDCCICATDLLAAIGIAPCRDAQAEWPRGASGFET